ncbi:hypothetical protein OAR11_00320 [Alphaproteobacteria bacterium]|nr:hypothetical protein [Alphaproteobacteria bacterium]
MAWAASADVQRRFAVDDLGTTIENAPSDYNLKTLDRLAFLREQAAIARKLGASENTIEAQTFTTKSCVLEQNKGVERARRAFDLMPAGAGKDFVAASLEPAATEFKSQSKGAVMLALVVVVCGVAGFVFVPVTSSMRARRERDTAA